MTDSMQRATIGLEVKALDDTARTFSGYASTWQQDLGGDVVERGAFAGTLASWREGKRVMPLLNGHDAWNIMSAVGQMVDATEDEYGLLTTWEVIAGADGDAVLARLRPSAKTGRAVIGSMSIGYVPKRWRIEQPDEATRIRHIEEIDLKEVSLVVFPMNPGATIDAVSVKAQLDALPAEQRTALLKHYAEPSAPENVPASMSVDPWEVPGDTPLDRLKIQRLNARRATCPAPTVR